MSKDIVATAQAAGQFHTLTALLKRAGLAKTLQGKGPFTVFAPTDAALPNVAVPARMATARDSSDAPAFNTSAHAVPSGYFK